MSSGSNGITVPKLISSSCESAETFGGWQLKWDAWERTKNRTRWSGAACLVKRTKNKQEDSRIWTVSSSLPPPPVTQLHTDRRVISLPALFHRGGLLLFSGICVVRRTIMSLRIIVVLAVLTGVTGSLSVTIRPEADSADMSAHPNSVPETEEETELLGQVRRN